jgi:hypothetical protein
MQKYQAGWSDVGKYRYLPCPGIVAVSPKIKGIRVSEPGYFSTVHFTPILLQTAMIASMAMLVED